MMVAVESKQKITQMHSSTHTTVKRRVYKGLNPKLRKRTLVMVGAFFLLILVNLIIQAMIAQTQYRINMRQNEINALERRVNLIYLKLADLGSDKRIERIAEEKLEMHPAHADEIAFIPVGRREGTSLNHSKRNHSDLLMAQLDDLDQPGFGQRISEWMQGLGRTLAGTSPAELQ